MSLLLALGGGGGGALTGSVVSASAVAGTLTGAGALAGSVSSASAAAGALTGLGALAGSVASASSITGDLTGDAVEPPAAAPEKSAAGDNPRRRRKARPSRTWTLAEWQEEQRRLRQPPPDPLVDVEPPQAPQPIPDPPGLRMPSGALAGLIPPIELPPFPAPRAVPREWEHEEEELELLLLA